MASDKTNVMRVLEQHKIAYKPHEYPHGKDAVDGVSVAELLGQNPDQVFKTLVARGKSGGFHVFVIPVAKELDLKKAAKAAGEKSVEMVHVKELLGLTGYVRGGCSPVGMKKAFPTVFDESVNNVPTVMVSAGKIGFQIECAPADLIKLVRATTAHITTDYVCGFSSPAASGNSANTFCTPQPASCASLAASVESSSYRTKCACPSAFM